MRARPPIHSTRGLAFLFAFVSALVVASVARGALNPATGALNSHRVDTAYAASFKHAWNKLNTHTPITEFACLYVPAVGSGKGAKIPAYEDCLVKEKIPGRGILCGELALRTTFDKKHPELAEEGASQRACKLVTSLIASVLHPKLTA